MKSTPAKQIMTLLNRFWNGEVDRAASGLATRLRHVDWHMVRLFSGLTAKGVK
jgi:hypothetical protein